MHKKLILTSVLALAVAGPAFATPTTGTWNSTTGTMYENTVYTGAATEDKTGIYSGNVTAEAYYQWVGGMVGYGRYWPMNTEWDMSNPSGNPAEVDCTAGSYCIGSEGQQWHYESYDQGIAQCPAGFTSDGTYTDNTDPMNPVTYYSVVIADCYKQESMGQSACMPINHMFTGMNSGETAATLTGRDYYGWGTDTCAITDGTDANNNPMKCEPGYYYMSGRSLSSLDTNSVTLSATTGNSVVDFSTTPSGMSQSISLGTIQVNSACSTRSTSQISVNGDTRYMNITDEMDGTHCFCQGANFSVPSMADLAEFLSGYGTNSTYPNEGLRYVSDSPWYPTNTTYNDAQGCHNSCATECIGIFTNSNGTNSPMKATILSAMRAQPACESEKIMITWNGAGSQQDIDDNNAAFTYYGLDVRTPVHAASQNGKTFQGWRFVVMDNGVATNTPVSLDSMTESVNTTDGVVTRGGVEYIPYSSGNVPASNTPGNGGQGGGY